jgi:hypothetical protein
VRLFNRYGESFVVTIDLSILCRRESVSCLCLTIVGFALLPFKTFETSSVLGSVEKNGCGSVDSLMPA